MELSFWQFIFLGIPEGISTVVLSFSLAGAKLNAKKLIPLGIIIAFCPYLLRQLPITFGVHTIVTICLLFFMINRVGKVELTSAIINGLLTILLLIIFETITSAAIMNLFNLTYEKVNENLFLNMLIFYPHVILMFITAWQIKKKRRMKGKYGLFKN